MRAGCVGNRLSGTPLNSVHAGGIENIATVGILPCQDDKVGQHPSGDSGTIGGKGHAT